VREAADEVGRPVERVDDPGRRERIAPGKTALLADEDVPRVRREEDLTDERLALAVGARDDVVLRLLLDLGRVERAEVREEERPGRVGRLPGHVERGRHARRIAPGRRRAGSPDGAGNLVQNHGP
jgi:hypothetical protein